VYVLAPVRCAPPDNKPTPDEFSRCAPFLDREMDLLPSARVILALGAHAWRAAIEHLRQRGVPTPRPRPAFGHGVVARLGKWWLVGSYHVSQQNTQTGKLTVKMFDAVLERARACISAA
jgi:uracil-DNA glycosylase